MGKVGTEATLQAILGEIKVLTRGELTTSEQIVAAIRRGDNVPNGTTFTEHHAVYGDIEFVTRRQNADKLAIDPTAPTVTIQPKYLLSVNGGSSAATFQYDRAEAMVGALETGIPSGTVVQFTSTAYSSWTANTWHFTASTELPAGTMLCLSGNAGTALDSLKVSAYSSQKATSAFATMDISSGAGDATVDLGTWGTDGNHAQRISYGSNNEAESGIFQWLNGDSGDNYMDSIWTPKTKYDMMNTAFTSLRGFLGGFSDSFRSCLGLAKIHNIANTVFESQDSAYTKNTEYTHNGYFWLPSRKEIYGTSENENEDSEVQFPYYAEIGTADHDKLMYAKGASGATTYWLRTPYAGDAGGVRVCGATGGGALNLTGAAGSFGVAPLAILA